jgi:hypothetical protein
MSAGVAGALRRSVRLHHLSRSPGIHWLSGELRQERERVGTVTALATQEPNDGLPAGLLRVRRGGAPLVAVEVDLDHAFTVDYALIALRPAVRIVRGWDQAVIELDRKEHSRGMSARSRSRRAHRTNAARLAVE